MKEQLFLPADSDHLFNGTLDAARRNLMTALFTRLAVHGSDDCVRIESARNNANNSLRNSLAHEQQVSP